MARAKKTNKAGAGVVVELTLVNAAAKTGADRYANEDAGFKALYIPQSISRTNEGPKQVIGMSVSLAGGSPKSIKCDLDQAANKNGGDRYFFGDDPKQKIYMPQTISRVDGKTPAPAVWVAFG